MARKKLNQFLIYRWRFVLAYTIFSVSLGALLIVAGFFLPGGLSDAEIRSALISDGLNPTELLSLRPEQLIFLPYRMLQAASISVIGFNPIGIKASSILLGFVSALALLYLLNLWYRRNIAIITAVIAVTSTQFMLASQAGQAGITYIFLTTFILVAASMIARKSAYANIWVLFGFILAGISLYMPLNIYMLIALVITALVHPHARHLILRKSSKPVLASGAILFAIIIAPLLFGIFRDPGIIATLLGIPTTLSDFGSNLSSLFRDYSRVYSPTSGAVLVPVYGLGTLLLIALGIYRLATTKYTTKSYIISFWLVLLIPLICLNPMYISITFVPVVLLIAFGIDYLVWSWYRLFPRNPYARIFGLLPLAVLMAGIVVSNVDRYVYGFHYEKTVYSNFNFDVRLLLTKLRSLPDDSTVTLIVQKKDVPLYKSVAKHQDSVRRVSVRSEVPASSRDTYLVVERSIAANIDRTPTQILVNRASADADRFYLYTPDQP